MPEIWFNFRNAIFTKEFSRADSLLKQHPSLLHLVNGTGETVLHFLAVENDIEGVAWLWSRGADLNTKNEFGTPVIFEIASLEYRELFSWFVEKGVDLRAVDEYDQDVVLYLLENDLKEMAEWVRKYGT